MSILQNSTASPSKEKQLESIASHIKNLSSDTFSRLVNTQKHGIDVLWNNPSFSPQEIINALGSDALKVFQYHSLLTKFIQDLTSLDGINIELKSPPLEFTIVNGKITVIQPPTVEE